MVGKTARREARSLLPEKKEEQELLRELESMRIPTAAYCRLSMEGEESIENQIHLVHEFIKDSPDLILTDTYVDNGLTGTNFDRPEWGRLMTDVQEGRINAIVVKDLSRFGRHYVEAGRYINDIFPKLGVRFIAITDNFDNTRADDRAELEVPVKNMMNYYYANDMSQKIHATIEEKKRNGEVLGQPAFGYIRTSTETKKNVLRVDVETAPIVRMMYRWAEMGVDMGDIAKRLNLMGVPSPEGCLWSDRNLRRILSNPVYYGDFISGRWVRNMYKKTETDEASWLVFEEHHEGIVDRRLWDAVQKKLPQGHKGEPIPRKLPGHVFCSVCGKQLAVRRQSGTVYYHCPNHTGLGAQRTGAVQLAKRPTISEKELVSAVLKECKGYITWLESKQGEVQTADKDTGLMGQLKRQSLALMKEKKAAEATLVRLLDDYHDGLVDADSYLYLQEQKRNKRDELEKQVQGVLSAQRQTKIRVKKVRAFLAEVCTLSFRSFNEEAVRAIADRVELTPDGMVTVTFKMKDEIEKLTEEGQ